jgi:hypothetical protein
MSASIHFLNVDSGYATARHVLCCGGFDPDAQAAAIDVLINSPDAKDRALVHLHNRRMAEIEAARRANVPAQAQAAINRLRFIIFSVAVAGGVLGGVLMEAAMTAHAAAAAAGF